MCEEKHDNSLYDRPEWNNAVCWSEDYIPWFWDGMFCYVSHIVLAEKKENNKNDNVQKRTPRDPRKEYSSSVSK